MHSSHHARNGSEEPAQVDTLLGSPPKFDFTAAGIGPADILKEVTEIARQNDDSIESKGLFTVKKANKWMEEAKSRPIPRMLFGEFWFEGELCILFADSNLGKSILAVQIGDSIARGIAIKGFKLEATTQPILYMDFELSDKQFETRYSRDFKEHYLFPDSFFRAEINPDSAVAEGYNSFDDYLNDSLERSIIETGAKILIIDNITYLRTENEKAKDALPLMKYLKSLKKKYGLSIMALAHTPKRDLSKPLTGNDLQGSKMLMNFCDSAFSIGQSHSDRGIRYLKQIKSRNTEIIYDCDNVILCQIGKPINFLQFEFLAFGSERDHLRQENDKDKESLQEKALELRLKGKSYREIGVEFQISHMRAKRLTDGCSKV